MLQKVLIIDDSPPIHALMRARLKDEPISLHSASSGEEGLSMAAALVPDLILLDVDMPDPNGFEVCRRLKLNESLVSVPVIFLTGAATTPEKIRGLELGAVDYVTKPFEPAELRARVRAALRLKFMMDLLAKKAQIDALTGLWNRRYFDQRCEAELSLARRSNRALAVLVLGVDGFRQINDNVGHPMGDEVLRRVGQSLAENVRLEDIVCRYGGGEFATIAPNISGVEGAMALGERLRAAVKSLSVCCGSRQLKLTVSIGVACAGDPSNISLIEQAYAALRLAKDAGGNRVASAGGVLSDTAAVK
jgi:diguanylate cyclase (GGDEF)-like protein